MLLLAALLNRAEVMRTAEQSLRHDLAIVREHALKVLETQELLVEQLARDATERREQGRSWDEIAGDYRLYEQMAAGAERYGQVDALKLVDDAGVNRLSSRMFPVPEIDITDQDYWWGLREGGRLYVSRIYPSKATGEPQFVLARRLAGQGGALDGLAAAALRPGYLQAFWSDVLGNPGTTVTVLREDGAELARWPEAESPPENYPAAGLLAALQADGDVITKKRPTTGRRHLVAADRLLPFPIIIQVDRSLPRILAPWRRNVMIYAGIAVPAALILLLLAVQTASAARRERSALLSLRMEADRRAETARALRASEARYRGYFMNAPEVQWVMAVDGPGRFRFEALNPAFETALKVKAAEGIGRAVDAVLTAEVAAEVVPFYERCRESGRPLTLEATLDMPVGRRTYDASLVPLKDEAGRVVTILGAARDVTERREAEQRLVQAQKMETVGLLTGGVAHDFNNLLTALTNNLEMVRARPGDPGNTERLEAAQKAAAAGADLVRRLLAFARQQPLAPVPTDLNRLMEEALPLIRRAVGERVRLSVDATPGLPRVLADPVQMENALLNLAVNARDAMPDGGDLVIRTGRRPDGRVALSVADTGTGMPRDVADRVFEPFYTTKPQGQGTGLGLSTVYGFVQQSGGEIRLDTAPGRGARFDLLLPAIPGAAGDPDPARTAEQDTAPVRLCGQTARTAATVLLVEDEALVRLATADLLRGLGYTVLEAASAEAALGVLDAEGNGPAVDVLVTDIGLPGMDGRTLADRAAQRWPGMPVILMTGYDRTLGSGGAGSAGAGSGGAGRMGVRTGPDPVNRFHLDKPYQPRKLARLLDQVLAGDRAA